MTLLAGTPAYSIYNQVPHNIGCIINLSLTIFNPPNSIGLVPRKTNLSLVENPAFVGSIIDVLVGMINTSGGILSKFR